MQIVIDIPAKERITPRDLGESIQELVSFLMVSLKVKLKTDGLVNGPCEIGWLVRSSYIWLPLKPKYIYDDYLHPKESIEEDLRASEKQEEPEGGKDDG